jgi:hypothetical protein
MKKVLFPALLALTIALNGCYTDNEEDLYPAGSCDTTSVTYTTTVKPIIIASCAYSGCHGGATPASGIGLEDYAGLKAIVTSNRLLGVINHQSGFSPMPKNAAKLPQCSIDQITRWVTDGALNN